VAQRKLSEQQLREAREFAAQWGKIVARRIGPTAGPLDFTAMEQLALAAAAGLAEGTLAVLLEQQASALPAEHPCPDCGRSCPVDYEGRLLTVKGGTPIPLHEPVCHCPDCRRDFFPPALRPGP
jgi:Zn finger protein HypA/HybF involved in hydrogenase expression